MTTIVFVLESYLEALGLTSMEGVLKLVIPKGPCSYMVYTWVFLCRYMGTPLGPKYIPYTYMDPLGLGSRLSNLRIYNVQDIMT